MNDLIVNLTVLWLILDLMFIVLIRRDWGPTRMLALVLTQLTVTIATVLVLIASEPLRSTALWLLLATVNLSLASLGMTRQPVFAAIGAAGTLTAIILILLHSFASLPVIAVAAVFCLGSAVFHTRQIMTT